MGNVYLNNDVFTAAVLAHQVCPTAATAFTITRGVQQIAEGIYKRYARPRRDDEMDDFSQDCLVYALVWASKFRPQKGKAFNYVTTCVCNHLRQHQRNDANRRRTLERYHQHLMETA